MKYPEKCCFSHSGECSILVKKNNMNYPPVECSSEDIRCKFRKTEEEYISAYNRSVTMNRTKGNCDNCRYKKKKCQLIRMKGEVCGDGQGD